MARRSTSQDVADLAGVSRSAVSLVLNGRARGNVSAAKQEAVLDAARRLRYSPDAAAQGLRTSKTRILGVLTWQGVGGLPLHLIASALQTSLNAGYVLIKIYAEPTEIDQHRALSALGDRRVDGILVIAPDLCEYRAVEGLSASPVVLLNCLDPTRRLTCVVPDETAAGFEATQLLLDAGHREIGLVSGPLEHHQTALRAEGAARALAAAGLPPAQVLSTDVRIDAGCRAATELLTRDRPLTALVCTNERLAVGALIAAYRLGRSVPADLSLVSLDDREQLSGQLYPEVTRVERPDALMGTHAAELLIAQTEGRGADETQLYTFTCPVAQGASVAPPDVPASPRVGARRTG